MPPLVYQTLLGVGLLVLLGLELQSTAFVRRLRRRSRPGRRRRNLGYLLSSLAVGAVLQNLGAFMRVRVPSFIDWGSWTVLEVVVCFLVAELFGWVLHYVKHESSALWRLHFQHHRETRYDIWLVTHTHGFEVLVSGTITAAALVALGFSPLALDAYLLFYALANTYQHSTHDYTLGILDKLIVNPAYHRLHHAVGSRTNYGNTLTVWDVVFRTAKWPAGTKAPDVEIGIGEGPEPWGFFAEMSYFLSRWRPIEDLRARYASKEPAL